MEVAQSPGRETGWVKQSRERELTEQFPEVWVEDNTPHPPPQACKTSPAGNRTQPSTITSAPALGLADLAKPFTLYVTEKDQVAMGCCPRFWEHGTDQ